MKGRVRGAGTGCASKESTGTRQYGLNGVTVKFSIGALAIGALLVGGASRAEALPLTPADTTCTTNTTSNLNASALYTLLDGCFDVTAATTPLLYKQNSGTGGTEEGTFASSYSTSFIGTTGDWSGATITYGSGAAAYCTE